MPSWPAENEVVVALANAPTHLDPRRATDQASARVFQLVFNGLLTKDRHGNLIPDLAERWEISADGLTYDFFLRPGVHFHDGRPLRAADAAWTLNSMLDGTVKTAKKAAFAAIETVEVVDELTLRLHLSEPNSSLLTDLTPEQGIVPAGATSQEMNEHPIGTGPFRFQQRTPELLVLERFEDHFRGAPELDRVLFKEVPDATVRALELLNGSVQLVVNDIAPDVVPLFRENPHFRVVEAPGVNYAYLGLNLEDPALSDPRVRRALALSIDRQRLVDTLWRGLGVVTETMLPPGLWAYHDDLPTIPYDPAAAAALLEEAGYRDPDGDGPLPRLTLTYKTSTNEPYLLQAQVIQQMARASGIEIEVRSYEFATFYSDVRRGNFQMFSLLRTGIIDPNIYRLVLHSSQLPPNGQNRGRFQNARFDELVDLGAQLPLQEQRRPLYLEAQEIFARELPYISLYTRVNFAVMAGSLEGYESYPSGELYSLRQMRWRR